MLGYLTSNMKSIITLLSFLAFLALITSSPTPSTYVVHEKRNSDPARWTKQSRVQSHKLLPMRIGLTQMNLHNAYEKLMSVYVMLLNLHSLLILVAPTQSRPVMESTGQQTR